MQTVSKIVLIGFKSLTYCLRSVSGPLLMQKWPSFCRKQMVFYAQSDVPCISVQALLKKYCLSQSAGINKFAV